MLQTAGSQTAQNSRICQSSANQDPNIPTRPSDCHQCQSQSCTLLWTTATNVYDHSTQFCHVHSNSDYPQGATDPCKIQPLSPSDKVQLKISIDSLQMAFLTIDHIDVPMLLWLTQKHLDTHKFSQGARLDVVEVLIQSTSESPLVD